MAPEERVPDVAPRLEGTGRDCRVVGRAMRLLDLGAGRAEIVGRDELAAPRELAPELRPPPLLFGADAGGDFLRLCLACDGGTAKTSTPIETKRAAMCAIFDLFIGPSHLNQNSVNHICLSQRYNRLF